MRTHTSHRCGRQTCVTDANVLEQRICGHWVQVDHVLDRRLAAVNHRRRGRRIDERRLVLRHWQEKKKKVRRTLWSGRETVGTMTASTHKHRPTSTRRARGGCQTKRSCQPRHNNPQHSRSYLLLKGLYDAALPSRTEFRIIFCFIRDQIRPPKVIFPLACSARSCLSEGMRSAAMSSATTATTGSRPMDAAAKTTPSKV